MQTPFRNDVDALKTRLTSLDEELTSLRAKTREHEAMKERLRHLEREHEHLRREIDARQAKRSVPLLDTLRIASPCKERWEDMTGDDRTRFCARCQKNVHNLSELTRDEAETFLASVAESVCVRMYQRADGTVLTADCPVGVQKKRVKRLFLATLGAGLTAAAGAVAFWAFEEVALQGAIEVTGGAHFPPTTTVPEDPPPQSTQKFATPPDKYMVTGGAVALPPQKPLKPKQPSGPTAKP